MRRREQTPEESGHRSKASAIRLAGGLGVADIRTVVEPMIQDLRDKFREQLVAVVVYGSHARGTAKPGSDIDLLVVLRDLPRDWKAIHRLEDEWARHGWRLGKRFQVMLASPQDVEDSVQCAAPLMLEIHHAHVAVVDPSAFFRDSVARMGRLMRERGIRLRRPGVWEVPERAVPS